MAQKALLKSPWLSSASPEANGLALKPYSLNSRLMPFSIEGSSSTKHTRSRVSKMSAFGYLKCFSFDWLICSPACDFSPIEPHCDILSTNLHIVPLYRFAGETQNAARNIDWISALWLGMENPEPLGDRNQFCERVHLHLLHHLVAMRLHGTLGRAQLKSGLLVDLAAHDEVEHLSLARRQRYNQRAKIIELGSLAVCRPVMPHGALDRVDQLFRRYRLGQEILGARLDGSHGRRCVGMSGDEGDRQERTDLPTTTLKFWGAPAR